MDQHVEPAAQERPHLFTGGVPLLIETLVRNGPVTDWDVEPLHIPAPYFPTEILNSQDNEFLGVKECDNRNRSPSANCVKISGEITIPISGHRNWIVFSRAEGYSDPSELRPSMIQAVALDLPPISQKRCKSTTWESVIGVRFPRLAVSRRLPWAGQ
jgi:hypothetical protein